MTPVRITSTPCRTSKWCNRREQHNGEIPRFARHHEPQARDLAVCVSLPRQLGPEIDQLGRDLPALDRHPRHARHEIESALTGRARVHYPA